jgi:hypothetical protein
VSFNNPDTGVLDGAAFGTIQGASQTPSGASDSVRIEVLLVTTEKSVSFLFLALASIPTLWA